MKKKSLGLLSLIAINIIAVDNLRSLPFSAEYGFSLIFFYLVAALCFFIPVGLISAELATAYPMRGGIYIWIKEAFGNRCAFFIIYLQWIYNVVWYPTIMGLVAATIFYLFNPSLADHQLAMFLLVQVLFWSATLFNWFGMKVSSFISHLGAIFGTVLPMVLISALGLFWLYEGRPIPIPYQFLPNITELSNLSFLVAILFGLIGLELAASHADEVKNPSRDFPLAIFISSIIILGTLILASLAIAFVIPSKELNVLTGLIQAYERFFAAFHLEWMSPIVQILIIIGGLSSVAAWILGPSKGLFMAASYGNIPPFFTKLNQHGVPTHILLTQGCIYTLLSSLFIFMPSIASSYWILSAMTSQLALIVYIALFAAAIVLRYKAPHQPRPYKIPGGNIGILLLGGFGIAASLIGILVGFIPPSQIPVGNVYLFETILIGGILLLSGIPFLIYRSSKNER
ncbi:MAG: amino acid permease [Simkaniaceae bacterium]|nr:amino acid permease [Simkaniaceae bacterium]